MMSRSTSIERELGKRWSGAGWLLAAALALLSACAQEPGTGTARVGYTLADPDGDPLTCEQAGVDALHIGLFARVDDPAVAHEATVECAVDEDGEGLASAELPTGFYERSVVTMLDATGNVAVQRLGAPASWEYLSVEIVGGVPTDYLPAAPGVFEPHVE